MLKSFIYVGELGRAFFFKLTILSHVARVTSIAIYLVYFLILIIFQCINRRYIDVNFAYYKVHLFRLGLNMHLWDILEYLNNLVKLCTNFFSFPTLPTYTRSLHPAITITTILNPSLLTPTR